jgi:hypothetical protein
VSHAVKGRRRWIIHIGAEKFATARSPPVVEASLLDTRLVDHGARVAGMLVA